MGDHLPPLSFVTGWIICSGPSLIPPFNKRHTTSLKMDACFMTHLPPCSLQHTGVLCGGLSCGLNALAQTV